MRQTFMEIRKKIRQALKEAPMNKNEISNATDIDINTVSRHLKYLEAIGVVRQEKFWWQGKPIIRYVLGRNKFKPSPNYSLKAIT